MTEKKKKPNATMGMIRRTFEYLDERSFCTLFKALVRPHLEHHSPHIDVAQVNPRCI